MILSFQFSLRLGVALFVIASGFESLRASSDRGIYVRTINGLTERRLFDVATEYAENLLASDTLSGRERVDVSVALLDTLAQKAYQSADPKA